MNSSDAWHESNVWPNDPNGSLVPVLEASVEAAKQRHPSGKAPGEPATDTLTAADRCDGCGAGALYRLARGMKRLLFCHHHYGKHLPKLAEDGWGVDGVNTDLMEALYADRTTGEAHA